MNNISTQQASMTQTLVNQIYDQLFGDASQNFDLYEGTIFSPANHRIVYLSADIIRGIYEALNYEAGEAWRVILKNCGLRWGKRIATSFDKELRTIANRRLDTLTVNEYLNLLESYFSMHGWGKLSINLGEAERYGIVSCLLTHSIFSSVLHNVEGTVNCLIEGMLQGIFSGISNHELMCLEIISAAQIEPAENYFILTANERLSPLEDDINNGLSVEDVMYRLKGH
ncbi:hypothetical protein [Agitococcus lubricus]|uniref:Uncharacterized protein n=1 Tax=Agitococcus lubricus TaxID=1077255 RepID=A0A2T5IRY4_9GAMM|nr:hypothetical protein [Agitococcus lubricus]PTQ86570.1 hypothetical protein C8N29_1377 [Agitococcus lubricus]